MHRLFLIIVIVLFAGGCAKLAHLDQLLTLKALSDEGEALDRFVTEQDQKFEELLAVAQSGDFAKYPNLRSVERKFSQPIVITEVEHKGRTLRRFLYRYTVKRFDSPKVYLFFDQDDKLVDWDVYIPEVKEGTEA